MKAKKIHFIGVGGVGMAGLAVLMRLRGHMVSGCDLHASPRTRWLAAQSIEFHEGHDATHVDGIDELIVTPAVASDHPELAAARSSCIPMRYRGEALAELVGEMDAIAVCGSHGKTTTSTFVAKLLIALGENVIWCIGGETGDFPVAGRHSANEEDKRPAVLVVEADESDGTLALYHARTLIVNKCEYDHPDHFKREADYFACYETAKRQAGDVIDSETLVDIPELAEVLAPLAPHNRRNARAAVEAALRRGHSIAAIRSVLPAVISKLPDRRFQQVADGVYTDYAHHPTEMACAVAMARQICHGRLRVLFQPHRYSRTKALLTTFPKAFAGADEVVLCPTYAAFEPPIEGGDVADLYWVCREAWSGEISAPRLYLARSNAEAWEHARNSMADDDITLLLGAGDIIRLVPAIKADRTSPTSAHPLRRILIGAGSNTWKSDLRLDVEYVRAHGPAGQSGSTLGIPWMVGIPGTIGGWIKMNAGAFGHSISEVIEAVKVDGKWLDASQCGFSYRHSEINGEIEDVRLKADLPSGSGDEYLARRKRFPTGTKGSVFKNPPGDYAGRLLEAAGVKELRVGGAYVWSEHANVIVAGADATASDFLALAQLMHARVKYRLGIALEPEVCGLVV